jgi:4-amino-4-deoxy-L-arabinose transferase-like glycosyltransferase
MLYIPSIVFGGEVLAKLVHFAFGVSTIFVAYRLARKFMSPVYSLIACMVFYSNHVVAWLSITAYIDLARTLFEVLAMYYLVESYWLRFLLLLLFH